MNYFFALDIFGTVVSSFSLSYGGFVAVENTVLRRYR